jgi:hypothetical protein
MLWMPIFVCLEWGENRNLEGHKSIKYQIVSQSHHNINGLQFTAGCVHIHIHVPYIIKLIHVSCMSCMYYMYVFLQYVCVYIYLLHVSASGTIEFIYLFKIVI